MDAIQNQTETIFTTGDFGKGLPFLKDPYPFKGQQNSHGTEKNLQIFIKKLLLSLLL